MDRSRNRRPINQRAGGMDGFISRPSRPSGVGVGMRPAPAPRPVSTRRLDDFRRTEGFHAPQRRSLQGPQPPQSSARAHAPAFGHIDLNLPETSARRSRKQKVKRSKFQNFRRWAVRSTVTAVVLVLAVGGFLFTKGYLKLHQVFQGGSTAAALKANVDPTLLKGEGDGRVNVLLLGIGGAQHDGGDLTDTMMIASIDPVNKQAALISIPRDLWTKMPNNYIANYQKLNAAFESGKYKFLGRENQKDQNHQAIMAGFQAVDGTVEHITGVPIHYNMLVDFQAFSQAIDTVGGVTVNVPERLYDPTMAWENHWNPVLANAGVDNFDGKQALLYVRSRETSSDFARAQRQRSVLVALKDKTATLSTLTNPIKLSSLLSAFGNNVQSDISLGDMTRMADIMKNVPSAQIQSVGLTDGSNSLVTTGTMNGMSVVMPKAGLEDYSQIQEYIRSKLKDGYITKENAKITILNGSDAVGLATDKSTELKSYGYNVGTVGNAPLDTYQMTQIIDLSHGAKKYTLNYLKNRFNVQTTSTQLPDGIVPGGADIVIILGADAATTSQN